jgi:hypothetical protein
MAGFGCPPRGIYSDITLVLLLFLGAQGASLRGEDRVHLSSE